MIDFQVCFTDKFLNANKEERYRLGCTLKTVKKPVLYIKFFIRSKTIKDIILLF